MTVPVEQWTDAFEWTRIPFLRPASEGKPVAPSYGMQFLTPNLSRNTFCHAPAKAMPLPYRPTPSGPDDARARQGARRASS